MNRIAQMFDKRQYQELSEALEFAQAMIAREIAAGVKWNTELSDVYVVRVRTIS
jgi:hypothetical protein